MCHYSNFILHFVGLDLGHRVRYLGSLLRVDEPVTRDSLIYLSDFILFYYIFSYLVFWPHDINSFTQISKIIFWCMVLFVYTINWEDINVWLFWKYCFSMIFYCFWISYFYQVVTINFDIKFLSVMNVRLEYYVIYFNLF